MKRIHAYDITSEIDPHNHMEYSKCIENCLLVHKTVFSGRRNDPFPELMQEDLNCPTKTLKRLLSLS